MLGTNRPVGDLYKPAAFYSSDCNVSDVTACGASAQAASDKDAELLRACSEFRDAHAKLDRLFAFDPEQFEQQLFLLNQCWSDACLKAASLAATTPEGRRAKAAMLLTVLDVVLGPKHGDRELHEVLATSLARDF